MREIEIAQKPIEEMTPEDWAYIKLPTDEKEYAKCRDCGKDLKENNKSGYCTKCRVEYVKLPSKWI